MGWFNHQLVCVFGRPLILTRPICTEEFLFKNEQVEEKDAQCIMANQPPPPAPNVPPPEIKVS